MLATRTGKHFAPSLCRTRLLHAKRVYKEDSRWPGWEVVVGIEVHAQIKSRRKLFSGELNVTDTEETLTSDIGQTPNTFVSTYDAAFPGTLPHLNFKCVDLAVRTAIALDSKVQPRSSFDRKHYFYSDLPAGYQITQQYAPIAKGGFLKLSKEDLSVRIKQIQLEQDTAKTFFDARRHVSQIDLNRAGTGLMEIVSEPDMRSPEEAGDYVRTLQAILRSVGSSDGNMEQGSLRCDVNVSVNKAGDAFGTRCEIKNLNSVKFMMVAITSEVFRQTKLLESGQPVAQETRGFDEARAETIKLRSKEDAPDYRYMPDPNIPPLLISEDYISLVRNAMPELPDATRVRLLQQGLSDRDADVLMSVDSGREVGLDGKPGNGGAVAYFDTLSKDRDPKVVVNWMTHELLGQLAARKETFTENPVTAGQMGELIDMVQSRQLTGSSGKILLKHMITHRSTETPSTLAAELSLIAMSSSSADATGSLRQLCEDAIAASPKEAEAVRKGKEKVIMRLVGNVMKESRGRADAKAVMDMLKELLLPKS